MEGKKELRNATGKKSKNHIKNTVVFPWSPQEVSNLPQDTLMVTWVFFVVVLVCLLFYITI